jgi:chitodextrinase
MITRMPHNFHNPLLPRFARLLALLTLFACIPHAQAINLKLAWNPSSDPSVAGYNVAYGIRSHTYTQTLNAGQSTSATVTALSPGTTYYFAVTAYDSGGLQSVPSNEVALTLPANVPPSVALTSPVAGTRVQQGASINLTATASDSDGRVVRVEFYENGTKIGESSSVPYAAVWNNLPAGTFALSALAVDDAGAAVRSAAVGITVAGATPDPTPPPPPAAPANPVTPADPTADPSTPTGLVRVKLQALTPLVKAGADASFRVMALTPPGSDLILDYAMSGSASEGVNYALDDSTHQVVIPAGARSAIITMRTMPTPGVRGRTVAVMTIIPGAGYTAVHDSAGVRIISR